MALNPDEYAYAIAKKYGINLKGSGLKIKLVYDPTLSPGTKGYVSITDSTTIHLEPDSFYSEEELANTIAHELNHARSWLAGGNAPEYGPNGGYKAGDTLGRYIRGEL